MHKTETISEFLARGGIVTRCPTVLESKPKSDVVRSTMPADAPVPLSLEEYSLMYGEPKQSKKRKRTASSKQAVDMSALPDFLKKKYFKEAVEYGEQQAQIEDDEEDSEEDEQ